MEKPVNSTKIQTYMTPNDLTHDYKLILPLSNPEDTDIQIHTFTWKYIHRERLTLTSQTHIETNK